MSWTIQISRNLLPKTPTRSPLNPTRWTAWPGKWKLFMEKPLPKPLAGLNVVLFEARHAKTMADLVRVQGGNPISAPAMKEVPIENNPEAFKFGELLFQGKIDVLILLTGVGDR